MTAHVLVVGAGSAGKRHMRNLHALGARVSAIDPREDRLKEAATQVPLVGAFTNESVAYRDPEAYDGVLVASPPAFHVEQGMRALEAGLPLYMEKPVAPTAEDAMRLVDAARRMAVPALLGYTYRWWPPLRDLKSMIASGRVGDVRHVRVVAGEHLADWHPWERYQDWFMSDAKLGGGAMLDESHFVDLLAWLFGRPAAVRGTVGRVSDLDIRADDNVDAILEWRDRRTQASLHLDLYTRPHEKAITVVGERGTIRWEFYSTEQLRWSSEKSGGWETRSYAIERNDMFVAAAREFLGCIGGEPPSTCTLTDGLHVLEIVEAIRRSSATGVRQEI